MTTNNFLPVQAQRFALSGSGITSTDTSITLTSFATPDGTAIAMANLGDTGYITLEPGTSREENISFTGLTTNASGTVTLTGVARGLKFVSPFTETASLKKAHAGGTVAVLSNSSAFYNELVAGDSDKTITATYTFTTPNYPKMSSATTAPTDDEELATKKYVDDVASGGTASINRIVVAGDAGETLIAGQFVYFNETDKEWRKTNATTAAGSENVLLGIAQGAGTNGNPISGGVLLQGIDSNQSALTVGSLYYLMNTAGEIATTAGTKEVEVGYAKSATQIEFVPRFKHYLTEDQKDALAGTSGTPSATNKYVTDEDDENKTFTYLTAGESIAGATLPVPIYNGAANKVLICDGNETAKLNFIGFAISTATDTNSIKVQTSGVVAGFAGLTSGAKYYIQDTAGTIGTTPGTYEVLVGIAATASSLVIKTKKEAIAGILTEVATDTAGSENRDQVITTGFRPKIIKLRYYIGGHNDSNLGGNFANRCGEAVFKGTTIIKHDTYGWFVDVASDNAACTWEGNRMPNTAAITVGSSEQTYGVSITTSILSVSDTGFTVRHAIFVGTDSGGTGRNARAKISYEAYE